MNQYNSFRERKDYKKEARFYKILSAVLAVLLACALIAYYGMRESYNYYVYSDVHECTWEYQDGFDVCK